MPKSRMEYGKGALSGGRGRSMEGRDKEVYLDYPPTREMLLRDRDKTDPKAPEAVLQIEFEWK